MSCLSALQIHTVLHLKNPNLKDLEVLQLVDGHVGRMEWSLKAWPWFLQFNREVYTGLPTSKSLILLIYSALLLSYLRKQDCKDKGKKSNTNLLIQVWKLVSEDNLTMGILLQRFLKTRRKDWSFRKDGPENHQFGLGGFFGCKAGSTFLKF